MRTLIIGCGNLLRGDDAAGPVLVRRMWERGLPDGVRCVDGGTGGMDVAFQMRGVPEVILVDACSSGSEPGSLFEVPGHEVENLPPLTGINLHAFRWDHAIAFGHWLLKDDYPANVTAYLIEGERYEIGDGLSPAVDAAVDRLVDLLLAKVGAEPAKPAAHGLIDDLPEHGTLAGELRAVVLMTAAAGLFERNDAQARGKAVTLKEAIETFDTSAIVKRLKDDPRGKELLFELVDDPGVRALLAMHGIIRQPPPPAPPEPPMELVQLQLPGDPGGWYEGPKVADVTSEKPVTFEEGGAKILVLRVKDELRAFRNACGHVGLPLDRGMCDAEAGTITCPWHGFRFDADTGACLSTPECRLEPFPLRVTAGVVWVKPS